MISLKRYLDSTRESTSVENLPRDGHFLAILLEAYGSALLEMGNCSLEACPSMGDGAAQLNKAEVGIVGGNERREFGELRCIRLVEIYANGATTQRGIISKKLPK